MAACRHEMAALAIDARDMEKMNQLATPIRPASALLLVLGTAAYIGVVAFGVSVLLHVVAASLVLPCAGPYCQLWPCVSARFVPVH